MCVNARERESARERERQTEEKSGKTPRQSSDVVTIHWPLQNNNFLIGYRLAGIGQILNG